MDTTEREYLGPYELGKVHCVDCMEALPQLPDKSVQALITDPPYNADKDYGVCDDNLPPEKYGDVMRAAVSEAYRIANTQFWVAPRYKMALWSGMLKGAHLIVIRRGAAGPIRQGWSDQFETCFAVGKPNKVISDLWEDIRLKGEGYFFREETFGHPGYTPYPIMARAIELFSNPSDIILDPFMGSGTTGVAAVHLGRRFLGFEIDPEYCELANKRIAEEKRKVKRGIPDVYLVYRNHKISEGTDNAELLTVVKSLDDLKPIEDKLYKNCIVYAHWSKTDDRAEEDEMVGRVGKLLNTTSKGK